MGASIGKGLREFKRSLTETQDEVMRPDSHQTLPPRQMDASQPPAQSTGEPKRLSQ
jgi:Sec-independent protein translocase protein TatA